MDLFFSTVLRGDPRSWCTSSNVWKEQFPNWTKPGYAGDDIFCGEAQGAGVEDFRGLFGKALGTAASGMKEVASTAVDIVGTRAL